jgi:eukaryotic-like serine/threonine-protein kinase
VEVNRRIFGLHGLEYAQALNGLAIAAEWQGRLAQAESLFEECLQIARPKLGDTHPRVQTYRVNLARVRIARGDGATTESWLREILSAREKLYPSGDWRVAQAQSLLAASLMSQKRYADAEPLMVAADSSFKPVGGIEERERAANRARLAVARQLLGRPEPAPSAR